MSDSDFEWCHNVTELKGGTTDEVLQGVFCGREELLLVVGTLTFQDLLHEQEQKKENRKAWYLNKWINKSDLDISAIILSWENIFVGLMMVNTINLFSIWNN